jgi:TonB family protein
MNRLHKKCLIASAALHSLLFVILLVGPAFLAEKSVPIDMPVLDVIPSKLIDELMSGGGNPKAQPPPPALPVVTPPSVKPTPVPKPPEKKPEPPQKEPIKALTPEPIPEDKPPRKPLPKVNLKPVIRSNVDPKARKQAEAEAQAKASADAAKVAAAIQSTARSIKEGLSSSTSVEVPGPGGEAYANYSRVVISVYQQAWLKPEDVRQEVTIVQATVTIARDGTVLSARITKSSGNGSVDKSVQRTLERVKFVAPFPEGAKEPQRNFDLEFNLKSKQSLG